MFDMKVVLLAGGFGTRLSEYTKTIPKPMINIGGKPMLLHIMKQYAKYGFKDFYIALGYKGEIIKKFFNKKFFSWNVNLIETGKNTMTGGRLKRIKKFIGNETFMLTYGDGVSNINISKLVEFHKKHGKDATLTSVSLPGRFGALDIHDNQIKKFTEKNWFQWGAPRNIKKIADCHTSPEDPLGCPKSTNDMLYVILSIFLC